MEGPRLDAHPEDADGELDQFARRRCFNLSSGTNTLPGQPDEGSLAMGSSSDGATSVRRVAIPTDKRRRCRSSSTVHVQHIWWKEGQGDGARPIWNMKVIVDNAWRTHDGRRGGKGCYDARRSVQCATPEPPCVPLALSGYGYELC